MLLQLLDEIITGFVFPFLAEHHSSLHNHASDVVRDASDGALYDGGVSHQCTFHLERTYAIAR